MDLPPDTAGVDVESAGAAGERPDPVREIRDPPPQPLLSWRRLVIVAILGVAALLIWMAAQAGGGTQTGIDTEQAIVAYSPNPGGRVLRQSEVGVELETGYDGRLEIDGVAIPEEQMVGAIDPNSPEFQRLPEDLQKQGPRPNTKHIVKFRPGPGKAVAEFDTGAVDITVRYWPIREGQAAARTVTYTINVF